MTSNTGPGILGSLRSADGKGVVRGGAQRSYDTKEGRDAHIDV